MHAQLSKQKTAQQPKQNQSERNNGQKRNPVKSKTKPKNNNKGKIKVLFGNVQSLMPKMDILQALTKTNLYDIVGINESWLDMKEKNCQAEIAMQDFRSFTVDKPSQSKRGGGSVLYVKNSLRPIIRRATATTAYEVIHVDIMPSEGITLKIILVYRNPRITVAEEEVLFEELDNIISSSHETILMGDFNLPEINWTTMETTGRGTRMIRLVNENNLKQHVHAPTRGQNILDIVLSTENELIEQLFIKDKIGDHNTVEFNITASRTNRESVRYNYNFRRANFVNLRNEIVNTDFEQYFHEKTADECFEYTRDTVLQASMRHIPKKKTQINNPSWFNNEVKEAITNRDRLYLEWKTSPSEQSEADHKQSCREVKKVVRRAKRNKELNVARLAKHNPKAFYSYVNERRVVRDSVGPLQNTEGELKSSDTEVSDILNKFFASVFTNENTNNMPLIEQPEGLDTLENIHFRVNEVQEHLCKLNIYKSTGPDDLHPRILRSLSDILSQPLTEIFNRSMSTGIVPKDWKKANITAIYKKGSRQDPGNYRPISLTSVVGKIIEKLIKSSITCHLERNHLIKDTQHGFRSKLSCLTNLLDFFQHVTELYDDNKAVDLIYLDFQKAFDKVPHERLLKKVEGLGIVGNVSRWLRNWLTGREQRVCVGHGRSQWATVTSGVPQGSVLGPLLFIIYINDLDDDITSKITKFADDTKLCHKANCEQDRLTIQSDLDKLVEWAEKWQMNFNVDKCTVMHVGTNNQNYNYAMGNQNLAEVNQQRDLGVLIDKNLKWKSQVEASFKRANSVIGFISRNFHYKSKDIMLPLYTSLVRPHMEFAVQFWSPHLRGDVNKMERIQHRATKMIPELRNKDYPQRLEELKLISLERRRLRGQLIETFKYLNGFTKARPEGLFDRDNDQRNRNNGQKLKVKRFRTTVAENFFPIKISTIWNHLPYEVVNCDSVNTFKNRLDKHWENNPPPY